MNLLITGSEGNIGKTITSWLKQNSSQEHYKIRCVDKNDRDSPLDILKDDLNSIFSGIEAIIHLAANPNPFISKDEAEDNLEITRRIIDYSRGEKSLRKIINASSINVYPYIEMFERGEGINESTPLSPNIMFGNGYYAQAKIESEKVLKEFSFKYGIGLINLRLGVITRDDLPPRQQDGKIKEIDKIIHLKNKDLESTIERSLNLEGSHDFVCVSSNTEFISPRMKIIQN